MGGPACSVYSMLPPTDTESALEQLLVSRGAVIPRTKRGKRASLCTIDDRPVFIEIVRDGSPLWDDLLVGVDEGEPYDAVCVVTLCASLNQPADYELLTSLARELAPLVGSHATPPIK